MLKKYIKMLFFIAFAVFLCQNSCSLYAHTIDTLQLSNQIILGNIIIVLKPEAKNIISQGYRVFMSKDEATKKELLKRQAIYMPLVQSIFNKLGLPEWLSFWIIVETPYFYDIKVQTPLFFVHNKEHFIRTQAIERNHKIDEAKHLHTATEKVATYIRKQNNIYQNWLISALSLHLNEEELKNIATNRQGQAKALFELNKHSPPAILQYLTYKFIFEAQAKFPTDTLLQFFEMRAYSIINLAKIAKRYQYPIQTLQKYNPWIVNGKKILITKDYFLYIPKQNIISDSLTNMPNRDKEKNNPIKPLLPLYKDAILLYSPLDSPLTIVEENEDFKEDNDTGAGSSQEIEDASTSNINPNGQTNSNEEDSQVFEGKGFEMQTTKATAIAGTTHLVRIGETLYQIARTYGISLANLRLWNGLNTSDKIYPGQNLYVQTPPQEVPTKAYPLTKMHIVKEGETLYQISRKYGVKVTDLLVFNQINMNDILKIGQILALTSWESQTTPQSSPRLQHSNTQSYHLHNQTIKLRQQATLLDELPEINLLDKHHVVSKKIRLIAPEMPSKHLRGKKVITDKTFKDK